MVVRSRYLANLILSYPIRATSSGTLIPSLVRACCAPMAWVSFAQKMSRSEEHTSELQSRGPLVYRLHPIITLYSSPPRPSSDLLQFVWLLPLQPGTSSDQWL